MLLSASMWRLHIWCCMFFAILLAPSLRQSLHKQHKSFCLKFTGNYETCWLWKYVNHIIMNLLINKVDKQLIAKLFNELSNQFYKSVRAIVSFVLEPNRYCQLSWEMRNRNRLIDSNVNSIFAPPLSKNNTIDVFANKSVFFIRFLHQALAPRQI